MLPSARKATSPRSPSWARSATWSSTACTWVRSASNSRRFRYAAQRPVQAPGQQLGRGPAQDPPARGRQSGAQAHPCGPVRADRDPGPLQHLLAGGGDLQQPAAPAAGAAGCPGQGRPQRPLQEVGRGAPCVGAVPRPGRQPQQRGRQVDPQPAWRGERIALDVFEGQVAGIERVAAPAKVAIVTVRAAIDPVQVVGKRAAHVGGSGGLTQIWLAGSMAGTGCRVAVLPRRVQPGTVLQGAGPEPDCR